MEELKACPFCGGKAYLRTVMNRNFAECEACYADGPQEASREKAADSWNRRAAPGNKALTLSELRQMDENTDVEIVPLKPRLWHAYKEGISTNCFETYRYEDYGKTWFAYTRKPEGSDSNGQTHS
jgi:Lar family restriction alleviation protein